MSGIAISKYTGVFIVACQKESNKFCQPNISTKNMIQPFDYFRWFRAFTNDNS